MLNSELSPVRFPHIVLIKMDEDKESKNPRDIKGIAADAILIIFAGEAYDYLALIT